MDYARLIVIGVIVIAVVALLVWALIKKTRSKRLRREFGPEYRRVVEELGDVRRAELELEARRRRVRRLVIRPLGPSDAERFADAWRTAQARFVDEPSVAIADADHLVRDLMNARGYPVADFEQRVADISVDHPRVVDHYRVAQRIAGANKDRQASTEDLRQAMVHYRALFDDLLEVDEAQPRQREVG
jgi:hypothetical protein